MAFKEKKMIEINFDLKIFLWFGVDEETLMEKEIERKKMTANRSKLFLILESSWFDEKENDESILSMETKNTFLATLLTTKL